jgi:hypothetical protein
MDSRKIILYDSEFLKVIEVPKIFEPIEPWNMVNKLLQNGYTIKTVFQRESMKHVHILLEKIR